jgi:hypothetical protein|tara:strand:- start:295 stop:618 length:324 start_codon:yes stop_codon:yes gene_type:complete
MKYPVSADVFRCEFKLTLNVIVISATCFVKSDDFPDHGLTESVVIDIILGGFIQGVFEVFSGNCVGIRHNGLISRVCGNLMTRGISDIDFSQRIFNSAVGRKKGKQI